MERKEFLELCQRVSVLPDSVIGKQRIPLKLLVECDGIRYYPLKLTIWFENGKPQQTAILHDLKSKSIVDCQLVKVERVF